MRRVRRLFWLALGATVGVLVVRRLSRAADSLSPTGLGRSISGLSASVRELAATVREGMDEREQELRIALGVDAGTMDPEQARSLIEHPTASPPGG